jgi:RNA polymerase sigma-70 factor, ECF subfamily
MIPWSLERSESISPRRAFLSVCPPASGTDAGVAPASERACSVPHAPTVAVLHAAPVPTASEPANTVSPASGTRPSRVSLRSELVAMLPSLERRAYRWCRDPAEAQDLAQDTVLRALGNGPSFDSEGHLRAWLYTVLRNLFISRRRRDQSWQRACGELNGLAQAAPPAAPPVAFLTPSIERAIAGLPEAFARVICLVDLQDYSYADAASTLGVPVGTVMSRLFRARQRLAQDLPALV